MNSKTSIKAEKLLKTLNLDECVKISEYDEIDIDINGILDFFENSLCEFFELSSFFKNIETIRISGEVKGKKPNILWKLTIKDNIGCSISLVFELAKKYGVDNVVIIKEGDKIKEDFLSLFSNLNYKKLVGFIRKTSEDNLRNGIFLRFVHRSGV
ncbi:MAG: hypothetical protein ACP5SD_01680 [Elusimicrobiales bacterium]